MANSKNIKKKQPKQKLVTKRIENSVLDYYRHISEQLEQGFQGDAESQGRAIFLMIEV